MAAMLELPPEIKITMFFIFQLAGTRFGTSSKTSDYPKYALRTHSPQQKPAFSQR